MLTKIVPAAVAVAAIAAGAWWFTRPDSRNAETALPSMGTANAESLATDLPAVPEIVLGDPDAPVTVIEYASFTCPHCANFHLGPFQQIKEQYIETGQVHFVTREVYFDRYGLWAAMVARCGGTERYHAVAELIYSTQSDWISGDTEAAVADNLRRLGRQAGLSSDEVNACLEDRDKALALTATFQANAEADDIRGTPTFIINGTKHPNMPFSEFAAVLDELLDN